MSYSYCVRLAFDDAAVFDAFVDWLRDVHVADVCGSGAGGADLLVADVSEGAPRVVEARYRFDSREAFEHYERDHAPQRRAEGLAQMKQLGVEPGRGVIITRTTGTLLPWRRR